MRYDSSLATESLKKITVTHSTQYAAFMLVLYDVVKCLQSYRRVQPTLSVSEVVVREWQKGRGNEESLTVAGSGTCSMCDIF